MKLVPVLVYHKGPRFILYPLWTFYNMTLNDTFRNLSFKKSCPIEI